MFVILVIEHSNVLNNEIMVTNDCVIDCTLTSKFSCFPSVSKQAYKVDSFELSYQFSAYILMIFYYIKLSKYYHGSFIVYLKYFVLEFLTVASEMV